MKKVRIAALVLVAMSSMTALSAQESPNPFGFTGHEYDSETGLYYMKGRYYDPETGRFLTTDPVVGRLAIPMTLHPYIYAIANPTVYIDPDGREVRVLDDESLELIKSTLPQGLQEAVQVGDNSLLRKDVLNAVDTDDPNFLALRELANLSQVTAVQTSGGVEFINAEGVLVKEPFSFETREQVIEELITMGVSREQLERDIPADQQFLFLGMLATPRDNPNSFDNSATISLTNEATVTLPSSEVDAPGVEKSKTAAHEIFGHALLFQQQKRFQHVEIPESTFGKIEERTENTFNRNMTGIVQENPGSPGGVVVKEKKNENQH